MRQILQTRAGQVIVSTAAVIAAGTAITAGIVSSGFDPPPPACYVTAPTAGASLTGAATLTAKCGTSTTEVEFLLDGNPVAATSDLFDRKSLRPQPRGDFRDLRFAKAETIGKLFRRQPVVKIRRSRILLIA